MEKIEISHRTIIFTIFFLIFICFLYQIRQVILLLFVSFITMAALNPLINKMEKFKIPRPVTILLIYFLFFGSLIGLIASFVPVLISQTALLLENLPQLIEKLNFLNVQISPSDYSDHLARIPGNAFKIIASTFSNLIGLFTFAVITFYLLMERKNMKGYLHVLFRRDGEKMAGEFIDKLEKKIGGWVRGELILMFLVGLMSYTGLLFLDLEFALPLAVLAGFLELVPNIGPTIAMIPAVIVGLAVSPVMGLTVAALYFLIQQLENNLIVPKVMQKSVGLNPLVTLVVLMIGLRLGGALGILLAVPIFLALKIIIETLYRYHYYSSNKNSLGDS